MPVEHGIPPTLAKLGGCGILATPGGGGIVVLWIILIFKYNYGTGGTDGVDI